MNATAREVRLAAILVLGCVVRVLGLAGQSVSMDEVAELTIAHRSPTGILEAADGFPPLYHLLLSSWLTLFSGELAARGLSVALGVATILAVERVATRLGGPQAGLWTALLFALSPFSVWYSQEARAYALTFFLAAVALWALLRALDDDRVGDWGWYAVAAVAGLYTHYFIAILVAVGGVLVVLERRGLAGWRRPLVAHLAIAALALPLLRLVGVDLSYQQDFPGQTPFSVTAFGYTYVSYLTGYALGPSLRALHELPAREAFLRFLPWLLPLGAAAGLLIVQGARSLDRRARTRLLVLALLPVIVIGVGGTVRDVGYNVRYALWAAVPVYVWLGVGAERAWRGWAGRVAVIVLIGLFGLALVHRHTDERYRNEDVRALAQHLETLDADAPLFILSDYMARPVMHYLDPRWSVYTLPYIGDAEDVALALRRLEAGAPAGTDYWLVYSRAFHGDPAGRLRDRLERRDGLERVAAFAGIELYRGRAGGGGGGSP